MLFRQSKLLKLNSEDIFANSKLHSWVDKKQYAIVRRFQVILRLKISKIFLRVDFVARNCCFDDVRSEWLQFDAAQPTQRWMYLRKDVFGAVTVSTKFEFLIIMKKNIDLKTWISEWKTSMAYLKMAQLNRHLILTQP